MSKTAIVVLLLCGIGMLSTCSKTEQESTEGSQMIVATLDQAQTYETEHPAFVKAFNFLRQDSLAELAPGRYEINGDSVFCIISNDSGKTRQEARLEAHRKYIDIQYVISGHEEMGWRPITECSDINTPYDAEKDIMFFNDAAKTWTTVPPGSFAIFTPDDAHAPMVGDGVIHKVVCKVLK